MKTKKEIQFNKITLHDTKGKKKEDFELNKDVFNGKFNESLLYQATLMYRANLRQGNASTKTRAEVRGAGKKPWRQKGTGRARVGSIRNPVWRGGGIAFGPHTRDFRYSLPKKLKKNAFFSSINAKLKSGQLLAVEDLAITEPKTKVIAQLLKGLKINERALLLVDKVDKNLILATRNIKKLTLKKLDDANCFDVLINKHLIITKTAAELLNKKVKK